MKKTFLVTLAKKEKRNLVAAAISGFFYSAMLVLIPFLTSMVFELAEYLQKKEETGSAVYLIVGILIFSVVTMIIYILHQCFINRFILDLRFHVEQRYFNCAMDCETSSSKIVNVINEDIKDICTVHYQQIFKVINSWAFIGVGMLYTLFISKLAFLLELLLVLISFCIQNFWNKRFAKYYSSYRKERIGEIEDITSFLGGRLSLNSNFAQGYAINKVYGLIKQKAVNEYKFLMTQMNVNQCLSTVPNIGTFVCCLLLWFEIESGATTGENGLAVIYVVGYILWEVIKLVNVKGSYAALRVLEDDIEALLVKKGEIKEYVTEKFDEILELENVSVVKDGDRVLNKVSISFDLSKKYLLIGKSGSGKSTLLKTLIGQIDYEGTINGKNSSEYRFDSEINYVPQEAEIIPETIFTNIAVSSQYDEKKIRKCASKINLDIDNVSQDVYSLSGGEIKKIEFLRGLYHEERKCWILDEPFESVDAVSRKMMEDQLRAYAGGIILASHIYTKDTINLFERLVIFENGTIVFHGTTEEVPSELKQYYFSKEINE